MSAAFDSLSAALADRYHLEREVGAGGMATVYLAQDLKHHRRVALKVLRPALAAVIGAERFLKEIEVTANLQHPHILPLFDSGEAAGFLFYVMPYVEGESLRQVLDRRHRIGAAEAVEVVVRLARALHAAHREGVLHRDIKPENVLLRDGEPLLADFGIAIAVNEAGGDRLTEVGLSIGTPRYMSPEQAAGERELDARSDIYSLACVLYEMLVGAPPHDAPTPQAIITARLLEPADVSAIHSQSAPLADVVARALATTRDDRYPTMEAFIAALEAVVAERTEARWPVRPAVLGAAALAVVVALGGWLLYRSSVRADREALRIRIGQLTDSARFSEALLLARQLGEPRPGDSAATAFWQQFALPVRIVTHPAGARASWRPFGGADTAWQPLGITPTDSIWVSRSPFQLRLERPGSTDFEGTVWAVWQISLAPGDTIRLTETDELPEGTVLVGGDDVEVQAPGLEALPTLELPEYLIDRYEVTNRRFKAFVDAGGYADSSWWPTPFERDGRRISWAEARRAFVDRTGRPGPSTWELGDYPDGQDDYPVAGVSWYEAAAFARFSGRALPSVYHWNRAAGTWAANWIVPASNLGGTGMAPVGQFRGLGPWGTFDMAGNVREWCANESGEQRFISGGGWNDAAYMFVDAYAQSPWDRSATNGFRLATYLTETPAVRQALAPITRPFRDFFSERPASDVEFAIFRRLYAYDPRPLEAVVEQTDTTDAWIRQRVSFTSAYADERVSAHVFLPRTDTPPYQTVVFFPGSSTLFQRSFDDADPALWDYHVKSGRAFIHPIYWGTYERDRGVPTDQPDTTAAYRDRVMRWVRDFRRSVDYVTSRPDLDSARLGFLGYSWGGRLGPLLVALEPRIKVAVLYVAGLKLQHSLPEVDPFHFAPRVEIPVLMLNGRYDFFFPIETSQIPLYRLLGTAPDRKRHVVYDGGHFVPRAMLVPEVVDWMDRWLGPVGGLTP
jgi:dienelactone hydrolase/tRNA A-37 threonylcarbamoyl transferase component Bud32